MHEGFAHFVSAFEPKEEGNHWRGTGEEGGGRPVQRGGQAVSALDLIGGALPALLRVRPFSPLLSCTQLSSCALKPEENWLLLWFPEVVLFVLLWKPWKDSGGRHLWGPLPSLHFAISEKCPHPQPRQPRLFLRLCFFLAEADCTRLVIYPRGSYITGFAEPVSISWEQGNEKGMLVASQSEAQRPGVCRGRGTGRGGGGQDSHLRPIGSEA